MLSQRFDADGLGRVVTCEQDVEAELLGIKNVQCWPSPVMNVSSPAAAACGISDPPDPVTIPTRCTRSGPNGNSRGAVPRALVTAQLSSSRVPWYSPHTPAGAPW